MDRRGGQTGRVDRQGRQTGQTGRVDRQGGQTEQTGLTERTRLDLVVHGSLDARGGDEGDD